MTRPKLGYLLKKFPRLSETFVLGEILRQEELGGPIHVFSRRPPDDEPAHPQLAQYQGETEVLPPSSGGDPWRELFLVEDLEMVSLDAFAKVVRGVLEFGHPRLHKLICEALYVRRRAQELGIEHLHVHFATDSAFVAMLVRELGGPSYSITAHAKDIYRSTVHPGLLSRFVEHSAFTVTVCDANVRHMQDLLTGEASSRVRRLYNGIDLEQFVHSTRDRVDDHVLMVGRLVPKKGIDVLLEALVLLRDSGRQVRTTIVGTGEDGEKLRAMATELDLDGQVTFTGPLDQGAVRELMLEATVFCLPCIVGEDGNRDALPTVLLEALAVGLPCISTPVTGVPEILLDGQTGRIVPEHDAKRTAEAIAELLDDAALRSTFAERGLAHARREFDARKQAKILGSWFEEVTARPVAR